MSTKLFVGGLPWATTDDELRAAFEPHGTVVSANVVTDRDTGRSRGFGFVEYDNEQAASKAVEALHQTELGGRTIQVEVAKGRR
jgi:RNA recognition motif-containing protein